MIDPFTNKYPITNDWSQHIARGSLGGIDYAMAVGTPLKAVMSGRLTNIPYNGTGGHTATITNGNVRVQYMHLSRFTNARSVKEGEIIGYSGGARGADGAGSSTGPHLHIHAIVNGKRVDFRSLIRKASANAVKKVLRKVDKMGIAYVSMVVKKGKTNAVRWFTFDGYTATEIPDRATAVEFNKVYGKSKRISNDTLKALRTHGKRQAAELRKLLNGGMI